MARISHSIHFVRAFLVLMGGVLLCLVAPPSAIGPAASAQSSTAPADTPTCIAFSPDLKRVARSYRDGTVHVRDTVSGIEKFVLHGHKGKVTAVVFSPDGRLLASGGDDSTVRLWSSETGELQKTLQRGDIGPVRDVAFSPDGRLVASADFEPCIRLWDVKAGELKRTLFEPSNGMSSLAFSGDGKIICSNSVATWATVWDAETGEARNRIEGPGGYDRKLILSPDGKTLVCGGKMWDTRSGERKQSSIGSPFAFSPDGRLAASGAQEAITLWDAQTWEARQMLKGVQEPVRVLAFAADGRTLAAEDNGKVLFWDVRTGARRSSPTP